MIDLSFEKHYWKLGVERVAGVDEAGRGPLAGPVVACAVTFPQGLIIQGVDDSKKLSEQQRERLFEVIQTSSVGIGIGIVSHTRIDEVNIYQATLQAMEEAVSKIFPPPQHILVDGPRYRECGIPVTPIVDGDEKCFSIAAASIVAKVVRDRLMKEYDKQFPGYGFAKHKGYGTREHLDAIRKFGPCEIHRRSFRMPMMVAADVD